MTIPKKSRDVVVARSGGICEGCGVRRATDMHHRKFLSRGGDHSPANLAHLCGGASGLAGGNHSGCHGLAHSATPPEGWSIPSGIADPATTDFCTLDGRRLRFTPEGEAVDIPTKTN